MKYPKLDKTHNYLGHFKGCLKEGHNTNGKFKENVRGDLPMDDREPRVKTPPSAGIRG